MGRLREFSELKTRHCDRVATMPARSLRWQCQQHLTLLTLGRGLAVEPKVGLQAMTANSQVDRDRQQPLQTCHRRIPHSKNQLHHTPQGFQLLAKKAFIPAVKKVVTL